jgi:hypothetical protein
MSDSKVKKMNPKDQHVELQQPPVSLPGQSKQLLTDGEYPGGWDMEEFKNLKSYAARGRYAKEKLGRLGSGSARIVFEIDDDTVLKLARNKKGLAQNGLEAEISSTNWYDFVAKVTDAEPNDLWIESEKARKMKRSDFKRLTGFKFDDFVNALINEAGKRDGRRPSYFNPVDPEVAGDIYDDELFNSILSFIADYDMAPGDFQRISSWGVVLREGHEIPVLIDYGVSKDIFNDLYVKKR